MMNEDYYAKKDQIFAELINDVESNLSILESTDSQLNRRNYLRSLFTLYEALLSNLREYLSELIAYGSNRDELNLNELIPLLDNMPYLDKKGEINLYPNKNSFLNLTQYCFKKWTKFLKYNESDIFDSDDWISFKKTVNIRNRITHPKFEKDVNITDNELTIIRNSERWWQKTDNLLKTYWRKIQSEKIDYQ